MVFHPGTSLQCVSAGGVAITPGGCGGQGDKPAVPEAACKPADPLTISVSAGGWRDRAQKDPFPPNIPRCPPGRAGPRGERPYSHHQAADHPGHHPAASGARGAPQEAPGGTLTRVRAVRNRRALGLPLAEADRPAGREAGPRGATRSRRARSCATPAARQLRRRPARPAAENRERGPGGSRPSAGVGGLARASLRVPGPQAPAPARGGICNSLESCTEPGSAQPRAAAHGASAERPEGRGEVRGRGLRFKGR